MIHLALATVVTALVGPATVPPSDDPEPPEAEVQLIEDAFVALLVETVTVDGDIITPEDITTPVCLVEWGESLGGWVATCYGFAGAGLYVAGYIQVGTQYLTAPVGVFEPNNEDDWATRAAEAAPVVEV